MAMHVKIPGESRKCLCLKVEGIIIQHKGANMSLEYEPIELLYLVLVIVAMGFALFFIIVSLAICCSYFKSGFGVPNTEDTVATNDNMHGPQILSVVSMHPYFDPDQNIDHYNYFNQSPCSRYKFEDEPPPNYESIFESIQKSKMQHIKY